MRSSINDTHLQPPNSFLALFNRAFTCPIHDNPLDEMTAGAAYGVSEGFHATNFWVDVHNMIREGLQISPVAVSSSLS